MSRWVETFSSHPFNSSWEKLKEAVRIVDEKNITDNQAISELARFKKVIEYIDKYLKIIEPEINSSNITTYLNNLNQNFTQAKNEINAFISNSNVGHIRNANNNIDNSLTEIKNFHTILPKISSRGIYDILKIYNDTLKDALSQIDLEKTINSSSQIETLKEKLLVGTDEEDSVEFQIDNMLKDAEEKHSKLLEYYNTTLNNDEQENTTKELIETAKNEIEDNLKTVKQEALEISNKIEELNKFYIKIFGELEYGKRVGGLKKELDTRIKALDDFEQEQQQKYNEILKKKSKELNEYEKQQQTIHKNLSEEIKNLLPSAASVGLAKAYSDERKKFEKPIKRWNGVFIGSLSVMFIVFFLSYASVTFIPLAINFTHVKDFQENIINLLIRLPLYAPLIWLSMYASKRRSENQRLEQEYAHKEALAKSYISYKQQIEKINQDDGELLKKLLEKAIDTISNNASKTLDKKHGDDIPIETIAKSIIDKIPAIKT